MERINQKEVKTIINNIPNNSFFTVEFFKRNGELRTMNCRKGVTKHLTPNPTRQKAEMPDNMVTVYDVQSKGYRHINTNTTIRISAERHVYEVR